MIFSLISFSKVVVEKEKKNHVIVIQLEQIVAYHTKIIRQESINLLLYLFFHFTSCSTGCKYLFIALRTFIHSSIFLLSSIQFYLNRYLVGICVGFNLDIYILITLRWKTKLSVWKNPFILLLNFISYLVYSIQLNLFSIRVVFSEMSIYRIWNWISLTFCTVFHLRCYI